ncbi:Uncharacterised protein [Mycobacteroides abscessus subsp. abscessus]|nr:Uncharacterised protein [Mycobacteroides abscessus subsp. abscessus]
MAWAFGLTNPKSSLPLSIPSMMSALIRGAWVSLNFPAVPSPKPVSLARRTGGNHGGMPQGIFLTGSGPLESSSGMLSNFSITSSASGSSRAPSGVSATVRVSRTNRLAPRTRSALLIRLLSTDGVRCSFLAAWEKLNRSATAAKQRKSSRFRLRTLTVRAYRQRDLDKAKRSSVPAMPDERLRVRRLAPT